MSRFQPNRRQILAGLGLATGGLTLTACGLDGSTAFGQAGASSTLLIGSADFPESQLLAEIYAAALRQRDLEAQTLPGMGAREAYLGALQEGAVAVVPDYSGNLLLYLDSASRAQTAQEVMQALPGVLPQNLEALAPAPAENKDSLVMRADRARALGLESLADLAPLSGHLSLAAAPEFAERSYGLPGLKRVYDFEPSSFEPINDGGGPLTLAALREGQVDIVDLYSTDPALRSPEFLILQDPGHLILPQQILPLVHKRLVSLEAAQVLEEISALLTTEALMGLNERVVGAEKASPAQAASDWVGQVFPRDS